MKGLLCAAVLNGGCVGSCDFEAAYLSANRTSAKPVYGRPPPGYRTKDHRGVPIVWELGTTIYGDIEAARAFHVATIKQAVGVQKFTQSEYDPCHLYKIFESGERIDFSASTWTTGSS